jgi:hypothetical protein
MSVPNVKCGESARLACSTCNTEYEVIREPKCSPHGEAAAPKDDKGDTPDFCPFCGEEDCVEEC